MQQLFECARDAERSLEFGPWEKPWYRGQGRDTFHLVPSLFRPQTLSQYCEHVGVKLAEYSANAKEYLLQLESDAYFEFVQHSSRLGEPASTAWDKLFLMRHYGLPTRTLDWSETLGVALHFALRDPSKDGSPAAIWILNPFKLNEKVWGERDTVLPRFIPRRFKGDPMLDYDEILARRKHAEWSFSDAVAVHPECRNERMHAQAGTFTFHAKGSDGLDQLPKTKTCLAMIAIEPAIRTEAIEFLKHAGINERSLFPGLEGIAREMRPRYGGC